MFSYLSFTRKMLPTNNVNTLYVYILYALIFIQRQQVSY